MYSVVDCFSSLIQAKLANVFHLVSDALGCQHCTNLSFWLHFTNQPFFSFSFGKNHHVFLILISH